MSQQLLSRRTTLLIAGALPFAGLSAACSSTPPRLFTLAAVPGPARQDGPKSLSLVSVSIPGYLDRPQIVRYSGTYEMTSSQEDRWSEPLGGMIDRVLAENLAQRLPRCTVYPANGAIDAPAQLTLSLDIARFDIQPDGSVALGGQWGIRSSLPEIAPYSQSALVEELAGSSATPDAVAAMSKALGQLSDQIVVSLPLLP